MAPFTPADPYLLVASLQFFTEGSAATAPDTPRQLVFSFGKECVSVNRFEESALSVHLSQYAVVWRVGEQPVVAGKLVLGADALVLQGADVPDGLRIGFDELTSVAVGRGQADRINGAKSLVLTRGCGDEVRIGAPFGDFGVVSDLAEVLTLLHTARAADTRVVVVLPIKRGTAEKARRLVDEGPPFDVDRLALERHHVFVTEQEVVFFFEGASAAAVVEALAQSPRVLKTAVRWRDVLAGRPRIAEEGFAWTRRR